VQALPLSDIEATIESLADKFLIEDQGGGLALVGVIREHALDAWTGSRSPDEFHRAGATYYENVLRVTRAPAERHFARREATYHLTALREFARAQSLRTNWQRDAGVASEVLFKTRQHQACVEVCDEILAVHNDPFIRSRKVVALAWDMQLERAKKEMQILRESKTATAWTDGAYASALLKKGASIDALEILNEGGQIFPQDGFLKVGLADYFAQKGNPEEALDAALEATALSPQNLKAHILASETARRLGKLDLSYAHAMKAMSLDPSRAQNCFNRLVSAVRKQFNGKDPDEVFGTSGLTTP
jgi:tetratricopeptide (TPR) repeat protein